MANSAQMTGMLGVYLVAAELSRLGFIVSLTSRSARGADLLVTDQECQKAWSVQVKTKSKRSAKRSWLVGGDAKKLKSDSHVYVFVNILGDERPKYLVVRSADVAAKMKTVVRKTNSTWHSFSEKNRKSNGEGWELFGDPNVGSKSERGRRGKRVSRG